VIRNEPQARIVALVDGERWSIRAIAAPMGLSYDTVHRGVGWGETRCTPARRSVRHDMPVSAGSDGPASCTQGEGGAP
jgi:hypothetical protein